MKPIRVRRQALTDAKRARDWYRHRDRAVADRFLAALTDALERLQAVPGIGGPWPEIPGLHRVRVPGFPYWVVFEETETELLVLAVAHERRRPAYWSP